MINREAFIIKALCAILAQETVTQKHIIAGEACQFLRLLNKENSPIQQELFNKGAIGEHILSMMMHWANRIVRENK